MEEKIYNDSAWNCMIFKDEATAYVFGTSSETGYELLEKVMKTAITWITENNITNFKVSHDVNVFQSSFGSTILVTVVVLYQNN
ncbi:MAG: hypothetical protein KA140_00015 [Caldisericia bacterium]|nr:hypothetical protein [Caldisericia bacterium]